MFRRNKPESSILEALRRPAAPTAAYSRAPASIAARRQRQSAPPARPGRSSNNHQAPPQHGATVHCPHCGSTHRPRLNTVMGARWNTVCVDCYGICRNFPARVLMPVLWIGLTLVVLAVAMF